MPFYFWFVVRFCFAYHATWTTSTQEYIMISINNIYSCYLLTQDIVPKSPLRSQLMAQASRRYSRYSNWNLVSIVVTADEPDIAQRRGYFKCDHSRILSSQLSQGALNFQRALGMSWTFTPLSCCIWTLLSATGSNEMQFLAILVGRVCSNMWGSLWIAWPWLRLVSHLTFDQEQRKISVGYCREELKPVFRTRIIL